MADDKSTEILSTMLDALGFDSKVELESTEHGPCLQITSPDSKHIIGQKGDRLDDFQYLVNRVLQTQDPESERVRVDCDHYREQSEARLKEKVLRYAQEVKETGEAKRLPPLNAYHRRLVHNYLVDDHDIKTISPEGNSRFKKITITLNSGE